MAAAESCGLTDIKVARYRGTKTEMAGQKQEEPGRRDEPRDKIRAEKAGK